MIDITSSVPVLGYVLVGVPLAIILVWLVRSVLVAREVEQIHEADEGQDGPAR